ncbi:MAG TPA: glutamate racemase [Dongiaceae bacterium]|nr:glutamate racemase [Dongiaceae bacterium]
MTPPLSPPASSLSPKAQGFWSQQRQFGPIGVFDSGHGGLTVLRGLVDRLPRQPFIYLGDHANAPYGPRSGPEIYDLTRRAVAQLFALGCGLVVLACNTASAVALRKLQQEWLPEAYPQHRVLGVLVPMVEALARTNWYSETPEPEAPQAPAEMIAVFATPATVTAGSYVDEVKKRAPRVAVLQQACAELVPLIESGADDAAIKPHVDRYVAELLAAAARLHSQWPVPNKAVLGCTHYPLIQHLFAAALPPETEILSQPKRVAEALISYLWRHPEFRHFEAAPVVPLCFTSGDATRISTLASRFFGGHLVFHPLSDAPHLVAQRR